MGCKWRKAKLALGLNSCYHVPRTVEDDLPPSSESFSDAALLCNLPAPPPASWSRFDHTSPVPAARRLLSKSFGRSSKKTCSICLATINPGDGHAVFTSECSHSFHFHCVTLNQKFGNPLCPVCRTKWKEIPLQSPKSDPIPGRTTINTAGWPQNNALITVIHRLPPSHPNFSQHVLPLFQATEPAVFDDDECLNRQEFSGRNVSDSTVSSSDSMKTIDIRTYPEVSSIPRTECCDDFTVLIQLKAAITNSSQNPRKNHAPLPYISQTLRTPVDLVTVLDISGSMAGTKLALLKQAMGFVIQNLSSNDRLSVIAFSSTARRLFPLCQMSETGRQQALQAVNSLVANGGTNIAEGLRKGAKVMEERREKNAVASIILFSDGQDTYTVNGSGGNHPEQNYVFLLPLSIQGHERSGFQIPVHTFGFGADHDASLMHSISETSGGTFSFLETEAAVQNAFAQCIGGLLSVVVQELQVGIECVHPSLLIRSIKAGSYPSRMTADRCAGYIDVGDLYADEERDFLVSVNIPAEFSASETSLLKVRCVFKDPFSKEMVTLEGKEVKIRRPETVGHEVVSIEVDRQRNRMQAAGAISQARAAAEQGDLGSAVSILENCRKALSETVSAKCQDRLCAALDAELNEMQERMANRHVYEASGRAYILSGLSSHSWQRATARGDSTDSASIVQAYQTPSMVEMLTRSQAMLSGSPITQTLDRPPWSLASPKPR
ncbi:hypothetical protein Nepgr_009743 [Nepenthes gracilis]|uniref:Uncharacterized protein n=1 Tax=Nepenthes gracilis TaxID=150966 RepID=A0AAD3XKF3_NEPGR|nr:hypothetical protein Nepgr_009743 [Nepenthes gracilis]